MLTQLGVVVQVMGLLSNNNQALRRFMQTFVLAPEGSVANKFYVHNNIFRYQDEVFGGFVIEPQEESEEEVEEPEERQQSPEVVPDDSGTFYDQTVSNDLEEHLEEPIVELEPEPEPEPEPVSDIQEDKPEPALEEAVPLSGAVPVTGTPPYVVKVPASQPYPESKPDSDPTTKALERSESSRAAD